MVVLRDISGMGIPFGPNVSSIALRRGLLQGRASWLWL
jgi:hypothetical protein